MILQTVVMAAGVPLQLTCLPQVLGIVLKTHMNMSGHGQCGQQLTPLKAATQLPIPALLLSKFIARVAIVRMVLVFLEWDVISIAQKEERHHADLADLVHALVQMAG